MFSRVALIAALLSQDPGDRDRQQEAIWYERGAAWAEQGIPETCLAAVSAESGHILDALDSRRAAAERAQILAGRALAGLDHIVMSRREIANHLANVDLRYRAGLIPDAEIAGHRAHLANLKALTGEHIDYLKVELPECQFIPPGPYD